MTRVALLAVLLLACSKKEDAGPPCDKVVDRMLELTKQTIPGHDPAMLGDKQQMIEQCKQRNLTAKQRTCIVGAKTLDELAGCTTTGRPKVQAPAAPAAPAAPGSGS